MLERIYVGNSANRQPNNAARYLYHIRSPTNIRELEDVNEFRWGTGGWVLTRITIYRYYIVTIRLVYPLSRYYINDLAVEAVKPWT